MKLTYEEAKKTFSLDGDGELVWACRKPGVRPGKPAGFAFNGGRYVTVDWRRVMVKRIVWLLSTGQWPEGRLYHRDGNPQNCRFSNLSQSKFEAKPSAPRAEIVDLPTGELLVRSYGRAYFSSDDPVQVLAAVSRLLVN